MIKRVDKGEASRFGSCQRPLLATTGNRSSKPKRTAKQIKSQREYIVLMLVFAERFPNVAVLERAGGELDSGCRT